MGAWDQAGLLDHILSTASLGKPSEMKTCSVPFRDSSLAVMSSRKGMSTLLT